MAVSIGNVLAPLDWNANTAFFLSCSDRVRTIDEIAVRNATWAKQIELSDRGNPALPFIRECQTSFFYSVSLLSLSLYKASAATMRSMFESALYFTYFRTHAVELATLVRDASFYMDRQELVEYHVKHTIGFKEAQQALSLNDRMNSWYKKMSRLVHSQVPGSWIEHSSVSGIIHVPEVLSEAVGALSDGADLVHNLMLCTVAQDLWADFSPDAKRVLVRGMHGSIKKLLSLDAA